MKISKKIGAGLVSALLFLMLYAQNPAIQRDYYAPWKINVGVSNYLKGKTTYSVNDSPVIDTHLGYSSLHFGFVFPVYRTMDFNIYTGIYHYYYKEKIYHFIDKRQVNTERHIEWIFEEDNDDYLWSVPIGIEYRLNPKYSVFSSMKFGYFKEYGSIAYHRRNNIEIFDTIPAKSNWFHLDMEIGLAWNFYTKYVLIQPYVLYNHSFTPMLEGNLHITGIQNKPYTEITGSFKQSGSFIGLGINVSPLRIWRKNVRNKIKEKPESKPSDSLSLPASQMRMETGYLGLWLNYERRLRKNISLKAEIGYTGGIWITPFKSQTDYMFLYPSVSLEPRWYYSLKSSTWDRNTASGGNFLALQLNYNPNSMYITNSSFLKRKMYFHVVSVVPLWGIKRPLGKNFFYELGGGAGYLHVFTDLPPEWCKENFSEGHVTFNIHLRLGYIF